MDKITQYNKSRWEALAQANVLYSQPQLDLNKKTAWELVDKRRVLQEREFEIAGKNVLCLASGGGQQSAAFGVLAANVTVLDFSATQLERDQQVAAHYSFPITTLQGDMRDLSAFDADSFDLVYQPYAINFIPSVSGLFAEVKRVLSSKGFYRLQFANPFTKMVGEDDWTGSHYPLKGEYVDGVEMPWSHEEWDVMDNAGISQKIVGPHEFIHTQGTIFNTLISHQFQLLGLWEHKSNDPLAAPGTWEHLKHIAPPWITTWWQNHDKMKG